MQRMATFHLCIFVVLAGNFIAGASSAAACDSKDYPQFRCASDGKCIDQEMTCNALNDCADGSDEKLNNCTNGCAFNTTFLASGETGQDNEWWYTCTKSRWLITGCVINGARYREGETFQMITRQGVFWGKCEKLDPYHYMRQPYGCVDVSGKNVNPGQTFQLNQLFWAKCTSNKTTSSLPEIGKVAVNEVKWKIEGCNDGRPTPVKDGNDFIWIIDPFRLLGVQIRCKTARNAEQWPDVTPTACVISVNETKNGVSKLTFKLLRNKCYTPADQQIFYCLITKRTSTAPPEMAGKVSTWSNDWLLNISDNNPTEINALRQNGYSECLETAKTDPVIPKLPLPPPPQLPPHAARGKRENNFARIWSEYVDLRSARSVRSVFASRRSSKMLSKSINIL